MLLQFFIFIRKFDTHIFPFITKVLSLFWFACPFFENFVNFIEQFIKLYFDWLLKGMKIQWVTSMLVINVEDIELCIPSLSGFVVWKLRFLKTPLTESGRPFAISPLTFSKVLGVLLRTECLSSSLTKTSQK